jgi:hypothetical protein
MSAATQLNNGQSLSIMVIQLTHHTCHHPASPGTFVIQTAATPQAIHQQPNTEAPNIF